MEESTQGAMRALLRSSYFGSEATKMRWKGEVFAGMNFSRTAFRECVFENCEFHSADMSGGAFEECDFQECSFRKVKFDGASFNGSVFERCVFPWASMDGMQLERSQLLDCDLRGVQTLQGARLMGATVRGTRFPAVMTMLGAEWGVLTASTEALALAFEAACHPEPERFTAWASGGEYPFKDDILRRSIDFRENRAHWDPKAQAPTPWAMFQALIKEAWAQSDWHDNTGA